MNEGKSKTFNSVVSKLLFIIKRARTVLEKYILFLMTRVSKSDKDDQRELK